MKGGRAAAARPRGAAAGETLTQTSAGRPAAAARNGGAETHPGEGRIEP